MAETCSLIHNKYVLDVNGFIVILVWIRKLGRDIVVGLSAGYGLDGPGIESLWGRDFPHPSGSALGPTQHLTQRVRPGRRVGHHPHLAQRLKKREPYINTPLLLGIHGQF
jgi:hypothetical protein